MTLNTYHPVCKFTQKLKPTKQGINMENESNTQKQTAQTPSMADMQSMMMQQMMQQQMTQQNAMNQQMINQMKEMNNSDKSRLTYILIALFLGAWGIHNFYAGHTGRGIIQLILGITIIGCSITIPWCILDMICVKRDGDGKKMK